MELSVWDSNQSYVTAATLSSNGLYLGAPSRSSTYKLEVQGNASLSGPLHMGFGELTSDGNLNEHSLYFLNSSSQPLSLTLPDAQSRPGQSLELIKTGGDKDIYLFSDNITGASNLALKGSSTPSLTLRSNGAAWYLSQALNYDNTYTPQQFKTAADYWKTEYAGNLLAHWDFDEPAGATAYTDSSSYARSTTVLGSRFVSGSEGVDQLAVSKDGNGGLKANNSAELSGMKQMSIATWIKPSDVSGHKRLISFNNTAISDNIIYELQLDGSEKIKFTVARDLQTKRVVNSTRSIAANTWVHIVATMNSLDNSMKIFLNGVEDGSANTYPIADVSGDSNYSLYIKCYKDGGSSGVLGSMDDLRIYNRALTAIEVADLYRVYNFSP